MKKFLITIVCVAASLQSWALTLGEARDLAREHYPLVRDYNLIELTEQYDLQNASKAWLPQVNAGAQGTWQSVVASYPDALNDMLALRGLDIKGMSKLQYKVSLDVQQAIWDGGRTRARKAVTRAESQEALCQNEVELYALRTRIDGIYFGILLLQQQRETITGSIELLQANLNKVRSLLQNGAAMQSDADAIEAELLSTRQQFASVESAIAAYRTVLGLYLGTDGSETLEMPAETLPPSRNATAALRPEYRLIDARVAALSAKEDAVKASVMPQIAAFAQGWWGYPGLNFMDAMMNRNPKFSAMVGVALSWNISSLYTRKDKLSTLQTAKERMLTARDVFNFNTNVQATQQRGDIERLHNIHLLDADIVALRQRVRRASEAKLREGVVEPTDLLLRITEERNAIIASNAHRIEYLQAIYSLSTTLNQ